MDTVPIAQSPIETNIVCVQLGNRYEMVTDGTTFLRTLLHNVSAFGLEYLP